MLPKPEFNIYPKSSENLIALLKYYFPEYASEYEIVVKRIQKEDSLLLNQIEFIVRKLSEAFEIVFTPALATKPTLSNLIEYGIHALSSKPSQWPGSKERIRITKDFKEFVLRTESKFDFLTQ